MTFRTVDPDWWRQAVVYQIYPRSFADADGNGIGDLRGVTSRVPHLRDLGVDAVWLSPFHPSALTDGGYDLTSSPAWKSRGFQLPTKEESELLRFTGA